MVRALGVIVPQREAEATRRFLQAQGILRDDLRVARAADAVVFPVATAPQGFDVSEHEFQARPQRPKDYQSLLPEEIQDVAPRAFDVLGDIAIVKVPEALSAYRAAIGEALVRFLGCRAAFHDGGVVGEFRTRDLTRIAGSGDSATKVMENGVRLHVDPAQAYFSPRLADERARLTGLLRPGERVIDLFGGVAPFAVQAAKAGCEVVCVDLNPAAAELARRNALANHVELEVICGDARAQDLPAADHVVMNLPHGAKEFFAAALPLVRPGGLLHHHEIMAKDDLPTRQRAIEAEIESLGRQARVVTVRHVRDYSTTDAHYAIDLEIT